MIFSYSVLREVYPILNKSEWADFVWYKNELGENNVDEIFNISKLSKIINNKKFKSMIVPGKSLCWGNNINSTTIWFCSVASWTNSISS